MHAELVERAMHGDQDAFASLAAECVDGCYALAYRILRDPHRAQDATQQALLGAWRDLPDAARPRAVRRLASPPRRPRLLRRGPQRTPPGWPASASFHTTAHSNRTWRAPSPPGTSSTAPSAS